MTTLTLPIGAVQVNWKLAPNTNHGALLLGLQSLGLEKYCPEKRTPFECLPKALTDAYSPPKGEKYTVKAGSTEYSKKIVRETTKSRAAKPGDDWGDVVVEATMDPETFTVSLEPWDRSKRDKVEDAIAGACQWVSAAKVSEALVAIVKEVFRGTDYTGDGGVYLIGPHYIEQFEALGHVVESSCPSTHNDKPVKPSRVRALTMLANEQTLRAVRDGIDNEIVRDLAAIEKALAEGGFDEAKCSSQLRAAAATLERLSGFEQTFETTLNDVRQKVRMAAQQVAIATIQEQAALAANSKSPSGTPSVAFAAA